MPSMSNKNRSESNMGDDNTNISTSSTKTFASNTCLKEPWKFLIQIIYFMIVLIPFTIWAIVSHFFVREKSIRNNVVLVTGTARGLGRSLAMKFAELGCNVACADIDHTNNAETVRLIIQNYPSIKAVAYKCDVALIDDIKLLSKNICNDFGEVDIIVNNAAVVSGVDLIDFKLNTKYFDLLIDVNLKSHFLMISEFLPKMLQRNSGHIVAIASLSGLNGLAKASVYSATKHGVVGLMESLYDELQDIPGNKIQTTCICPYFIATNELCSEFWDLRLSDLSVEKVTEDIISGIRRNQRIVAIPTIFYYLSILSKLLPDSLRNLIRKIFYIRILTSKDPVAPRFNKTLMGIKQD